MRQDSDVDPAVVEAMTTLSNTIVRELKGVRKGQRKNDKLIERLGKHLLGNFTQLTKFVRDQVHPCHNGCEEKHCVCEGKQCCLARVSFKLACSSYTFTADLKVVSALSAQREDITTHERGKYIGLEQKLKEVRDLEIQLEYMFPGPDEYDGFPELRSQLCVKFAALTKGKCAMLAVPTLDASTCASHLQSQRPKRL